MSDANRRYVVHETVENNELLGQQWVLFVIGCATVYVCRKYFCGLVINKAGIGGISHAVSRRRRILRDPTSRRPPPLITQLHLNEHASQTQQLNHRKIFGFIDEEVSAMPGGGRRIPRNTRPTSINNGPQGGTPLLTGPTPDLNNMNKYSPLGATIQPTVEAPPAPKHMPYPTTPVDGDLFFEIIMFAFTTVAAGLQFLQIYRSVWWLPHAYTHHAMNFYLIDIHLVMFVLIIFGRRLIYMLGCIILEKFAPAKFHSLVFKIYKVSLLVVIFVQLSLCGYYVCQSHAFVNIFYLCYPVSVYLILFGLTISPFFELTGWTEVPGIGGKPLHSCSTEPSTIRTEVDTLKTDFNNRMKQILFSSVLNAYYAGFIPCCFAQSFVYYDVYSATFHLIFIGVGCFTMYAGHILPMRYCDVLHRSALHLGSWMRVEPRSHLPVAYNWQSDTLWPHGSLVRHSRELYKAQGWFNAAEPGNSTHARFHGIFKNPSVAMSGLVGLQVTLVMVQLVFLVRSTQWQQIISLTLMLFVNYYTLFRLGRDFLIALKIYGAEQAIHEKNMYQ